MRRATRRQRGGRCRSGSSRPLLRVFRVVRLRGAGRGAVQQQAALALVLGQGCGAFPSWIVVRACWSTRPGCRSPDRPASRCRTRTRRRCSSAPSSVARNSATAAIRVRSIPVGVCSAGAADRFVGRVPAPRRCARRAACRRASRAFEVPAGRAHDLARTPYLPFSSAVALVSPRSPNFAAVYTTVPGIENRLLIEPMLTIALRRAGSRADWPPA